MSGNGTARLSGQTALRQSDRDGRAPGEEQFAQARTQVVSVWSAKGGVGKSTLVVALADLLLRDRGLSVCTVDLNPVNSSLAALVGMEQAEGSWPHLSEVVQTGRVTRDEIARSLVVVREGWSVLTGPGGNDLWRGLLTPDLVVELVRSLRGSWDYVLLDLPSGRSAVVDAALKTSHAALIIVTPFYPAVVDSAKTTERVMREGLLPRERCRLVLNQWVDLPGLPAGDVIASHAIPVAARIPLESIAMLQASCSGIPVTSLKSPEAKRLIEAITSVSDLIGGGSTRPAQWRR